MGMVSRHPRALKRHCFMDETVNARELHDRIKEVPPTFDLMMLAMLAMQAMLAMLAKQAKMLILAKLLANC